MLTTVRQQKLYTDRCDIYQTTRASNSDGLGTPGDERISLVAANVPCYYQYTQNVDDATDVGRFKRATIFTTDIVHFYADQRLENGWWLKNRTKDAQGRPTPNYGQVHKILGAPNNIPTRGIRHANKQSVMAMQEEQIPDELR